MRGKTYSILVTIFIITLETTLVSNVDVANGHLIWER